MLQDKNIFSTGNTGVGLDLVVNFQPTEKLQFSAAVTDIGSITWKNNLNNYTSNSSSTRHYTQFNSDYYLSDTATFPNNLVEMKDSLFHLFAEQADNFTGFTIGTNFVIGRREGLK